MSRRKFLRIAALGTASSMAMASVAHAAPRRVRVTRHKVRWQGRGQLRIAHLTDLHVGWGTPPHLLRQAVAHTRRVKPDLVVLTGDYLNHSLGYLHELQKVIEALPRPCVATLGNHDHWAGAQEIACMLKRQGVVVLRNQNTMMRIKGIALPVVGVDDGRTRHADVGRSFYGMAHCHRALVLSHYPSTADEIADKGGRLILSGHTHGGQIAIPRLTRTLARIGGTRYLSGWYRVGRGRLYVSPGIGSSFIRWRAGRRAAPEVAVLDLV